MTIRIIIMTMITKSKNIVFRALKDQLSLSNK